MKITVSPLTPNKPKQKKHKIRAWRPTAVGQKLEQQVKLDVLYSFQEIGYKQTGQFQWSSELAGTGAPDLKFNSWFEAKGWLQKVGAFKERKN